MVHPVFRSPKSIIFYLATWAVFIMAQVLVLYLFYDFPFRYVLWDASIYYVFYSFFGLGLWYPIRFIYMSESDVFSKILNFLGLGAGTLVLWQLLGSAFLRLVLNEHENLIKFNQLVMPIRLLAGALIFMILSLAYYLIMFYTSMEDRKINEVNLKAQARESELMMLKYQLNPHFLFNSLNSINSLTLSDPGKARNMILKLSAYLRYTLEFNGEHFKELKGEIDNIRRYLEIEKTRFGERIHYEEFIDDLCLEQKLPAMILQPLFENAIKHGVHESTDPTLIQLKCNLSDDFLNIELRNSLVENRKITRGTGTGLRNVRDRLFSAYGEQNLMDIAQEDNCFVVRLKIPRSADKL